MAPPSEGERLLLFAENSPKAPPPPKDGLPKRWIPAFVRWGIRCFVEPFIRLDLATQWLARKILRPPMKMEGQCHQRGNCCYFILMRKGPGIFGKIRMLWHTQVNGFYIRDIDGVDVEGKSVHVLGCRYLQKDGSCKHHRLRPMLCRQWPILEDFSRPRILKGCGFKAVPRKK